MMIQTVGDLKQLLAKHDDNASIVIMPLPDHNDYGQMILDLTGSNANGSVILGLAEDCLELGKVVFTDEQGQAQRPV